MYYFLKKISKVKKKNLWIRPRWQACEIRFDKMSGFGSQQVKLSQDYTTVTFDYQAQMYPESKMIKKNQV